MKQHMLLEKLQLNSINGNKVPFNSIEEYIDFNKSISSSQRLTDKLVDQRNFSSNSNLSILRKTSDHYDYRKLRKDIFEDMGYSSEFNTSISEYDFDKYDGNSIVVALKKSDKSLVGGMRLILDSQHIKLQSDEKISFDNLREGGKSIAEMSRLVIDPENRGRNSSLDIVCGTYQLGITLGIDYFVFGIVEKHFNFYNNLTHCEKIYSGNYGNIDKKCTIVQSDLKKIKPFLQERLNSLRLENRNEKKSINRNITEEVFA